MCATPFALGRSVQCLFFFLFTLDVDICHFLAQPHSATYYAGQSGKPCTSSLAPVQGALTMVYENCNHQKSCAFIGQSADQVLFRTAGTGRHYSLFTWTIHSCMGMETSL